jgi:UDP-2,4-diacetamido-2,4,6-trideoxy-beta-L-altropyranose hydrolase
MPSAIIRTDASHDIGLGHLVRSTTLGLALIDSGWKCVLATSAHSLSIFPGGIPSDLETIIVPDDQLLDPAWAKTALSETFDLAIIDHYGLDGSYELQMRTRARHILVIDDLANRPHDCDILLDQNLGRTASDYEKFVSPACQLLIGPDFTLLRDQFQRHRPNSILQRGAKVIPKKVVVSFGGSDLRNASTMALEGLGLAGWSTTIDIVIGAAATNVEALRNKAKHYNLSLNINIGTDDVANLLAKSDFVIGACGSSSWERCCLGVPAIVIVTGSDQRTSATGLVNAGAIDLVGEIDDVDAHDICKAINSMINEPRLWHNMGLKAAKIVDGSGCTRVIERLRSMMSERMGAQAV